MTAADDLRALSAAATPGPWEDAGVEILGPGHVQHRRGVAYTWGPREYEDADLIVWCRNHADALANLIDAASALAEPAGWWRGVEQRQEHQLLDRRAVVRDALAALEADQ